MTNRKVLFDNLKSKMLDAGFRFEREQKPHRQKRKELELVFSHPKLISKLEVEGFKVNAKKFYVKPLTDHENCEIGLVTGKSSPLYKLNQFISPNSKDSFKGILAWTNKKDDSTLDQILVQINRFTNIPNQENYLINQNLELFQIVENEDVSSIEKIKALQKKYKDATPEVIQILVNRIERGEIANEIKNLYGHKCLMCESLELNPYSFQKKNSDKLKGSKKYYVETHHIVPVSLLKKGSLGIENMITLCPNHHRQFHFGDVEIKKNTSKKLELKVDGKTKVRIEKKIEPLL